MALQSLIAGALGLCLLEVVLTSDTAASQLGNAGAGIASMLNRVVDPYTPLIGAQPVVVPGTPAAVGTQANEGGGEGPAPTAAGAASSAAPVLQVPSSPSDIPVPAGAAGSVPPGGSSA